MRINGKTIQGPAEEILAIPRAPTFIRVKNENGVEEDREVINDIIFKARAVLDFTPFIALCPAPRPPMMLRAGETKQVPNEDDSDYQKALSKWQSNRYYWTILTSLAATPGLEWDKIDMSKPDTWENIDAELDSAGFNKLEQQKIIHLALSVNTIDEKKMDEARARFLASNPVKVAN